MTGSVAVPMTAPTPAEKARMLEQLQLAMAVVQSLPEDRSCRGCESYNTDTHVCNHWNGEVPEQARGTGCDQWSELLPF